MATPLLESLKLRLHSLSSKFLSLCLESTQVLSFFITIPLEIILIRRFENVVLALDLSLSAGGIE